MLGLQHSSLQIFFPLAQFPLWAQFLQGMLCPAGQSWKVTKDGSQGWDLGNLIFLPSRKQIWQRFRPDLQPSLCTGREMQIFVSLLNIALFQRGNAPSFPCSGGSSSSLISSTNNSHICWGLTTSSQGNPRAHTFKKKKKKNEKQKVIFQHSSKDQQDTEQFLPTAKPRDKTKPPAGV